MLSFPDNGQTGFTAQTEGDHDRFRFSDSGRIRAAMMPTPEGRTLFKSLLLPLNTPQRVEMVSRALGPFLGAEAGQAAEEILGSRDNRFAPIASPVPLPSLAAPLSFMDGLRGGPPATFAGGLLAQ